jgi:predicted phosphodiesterase
MLSFPNRRQFLGASASAVMLPALGRATVSTPQENVVAFFLVGDTHFRADKEATAKLDKRSAAVNSRLIDVLNRLPGTDIPKAAGSGTVLAPRGVIHAGDCIDTGDKANVPMQQTEWAAFTEGFGLTGKDGKLTVPVYEVHGNHDSPHGNGLVVEKIIARNKKRPGVKNVSKNGLHYSWDWNDVHFINLGIVVGQVASATRKRRYAPLDSLDFLVSDLKGNVGASGRPVVLTHHVDMLRYARPLPVEDKKAVGMEWDPADVKGFHDALHGYNIAAILYGHTHVRNVFRWDGSARKAEEGIPVFNVDNSSHFAGTQQAFFYIEIRGNALIVREYQTADAWETGSWTPQTWTAPVAGKKIVGERGT